MVSDPIGDDANNEYVVVLNDSDAALDVSGWTVRDSSLTTYTLPAGTVIGPRDHIRIFTGAGAPGHAHAPRLPLRRAGQMFPNWDPAAGYFYGDGAYVYDAQPGYAYGNLRAWFHYPCDPAACGDRARRRVVHRHRPVRPARSRHRRRRVRRVPATSPRHRSASAGTPSAGRGAQYPFPPATTIPAGGTLRLSMGVGVDTRRHPASWAGPRAC